MPSYKLIYFNARGRAEPARMMFSLKGVEFTDDRFEHEEWPKRKADKEAYPTGQTPVLLVDGNAIPQSQAINRYIARELDFFGENNLEGARIDVIIATMTDVEVKMLPLYSSKEEDKKAELMKAFVETKSVPYLSYLEQLIKEAGGKNFVGNKISLADLHVFNMLDVMTNSKYKIEPDFLERYPQLSAFYKSFWEEGPLKAYLETRPVTDS